MPMKGEKKRERERERKRLKKGKCNIEHTETLNKNFAQ